MGKTHGAAFRHGAFPGMIRLLGAGCAKDEDIESLDTAMKRLFGIGCAKSGTHAVAALLGPDAAHEPDAEAMLRLVLRHASGALDQTGFEGLLHAMITRRAANFDMSQINGFVIETLLKLYPDANYLLTLRDAQSWLRSYVNHQRTIGTAPGSLWPAFRALRFATPPLAYQPEDAVLERHGLYPVDAYLGYWLRHNGTAIMQVPAAQLLVVPTACIDGSVPAIAAFLGRSDLREPPRRDQRFAGNYRLGPLDEIDSGWLAARIAFHTDALVATVGHRLDAAVIRSLTPNG